MAASPIDPRDLRVSDDERAHVLALLEKATGRGLIDIDEYTERSGKVIAARTRRDLNAVLIDLPGLQIAGRSVDSAVAATRPVPVAGPGYSGAVPNASGALELLGWGARTFKGFWNVPPLIVIGGTGASTKLDFTQAQLASNTVTVEFRSNYGGAAEFVVPVGTTVRVDALQMRGGHVHNKVDPRSAGRGMTLVLTGVKKSGSIIIKHPKQGVLRTLLG